MVGIYKLLKRILCYQQEFLMNQWRCCNEMNNSFEEYILFPGFLSLFKVDKKKYQYKRNAYPTQ